MKNLLFITFCLVFMLIAVPNISAQTTGNEKQEEEKEVDEIENALNDAVNKLEGLFNKKPKKRSTETNEETEVVEDEEVEVEEDVRVINSVEEAEEAAAEDALEAIFGGQKADEDYIPIQNEFIGSFTMTYEAFKNGKPDKNNPSVIGFTFDKSLTAIKMESKENTSVRMLMDLSDNSMTTISTEKGKSTGFKMRRPNIKKYAENAMDDMKITRTGETKTIDGYKCEKVIYENEKEEMVTTAWITQDIAMPWKEVIKSMSMGRMPGNYNNQEMVEGFAIESETVEKGGKQTYKMKTTDIKVGNIDRAVFDTSGVEIMTMPGFGG